jgi:hypothetical protein
MGAIKERIDLDLDTVKSYLFIDTDHEDAVLEILLKSALEVADQYCNNDFIEHGRELPIPEDIRLWVLQRISRDYHRRSEGKSQEQTSGLGSTTWGEQEFEALQPYRINPGF